MSVEISSFRLPKKTGTYADALSAVGLERLLYLLGAGKARIRDRGGFYELSFAEPVILDKLEYEAIRNDPGYRYVKLKENSPAPTSHLDYPAGQERWQSYKELKKSLGDRPTDEQREQLRQAEPEPRWHLYQNTRVLKGFGSYNKLHEEIRASDPDAFAVTLRGRLEILASKDDLNEIGSKFEPELSVVQVFTPTVGKGINALKTARSSARTLKAKEFSDWFDEYLKFLGLAQAANARAVGPKFKDVKLFAMVPGNITTASLNDLSRRFFRLRLPWSSTQIDIQGALGLAEGLVEQRARGELEKLYQTPRDYVAGLQTAYFLETNKFPRAHSLASTGFVGLPDWFHVTEENANEWLEILDEHRKILVLLNEDRSEEADLLILYRDFLTATDTRTLLEFLASYAPHVVRSRERNRPVRQFTTKNLRRLLVRSGKDPEEMKFKEIVDDPGFRAVAGAIRRATVTEQYHKSQRNQVFEVEYGLFQDLKRKARFPDQFVAALSEFVNTYNVQNARREEQLKGKVGRRRPRLKVEELDRVVGLIDRHNSETVAMLLIAYGSARDPRAPDEAADIALAQDVRIEEPTQEENIG